MSTLSFEEAQAMLERAVARAKEFGVQVSIAVVDASGHLVAFHRMSEASFMTADIAIGKAWTSAAFRASSEAIERNMEAMPSFAGSLATTMQGKFIPRQGGLLIGSHGGAVGVSGASATQDEEVARAAIA